ncbi:LacI family DNA-binding transcriptional regulator [Cellulomonas sp. S1-8]|uniref:LacI family DNA-binding transcriptional regulator n=1 Tax=Cellulomonas sp. S1-8 TaxID=2904790 RepID=UPI0022434B7A|nr:LacI family DNA-binding transcriptional regulator [Cellulomonas sp. S1-8]UZN01488.1 LacI family transcriptional regulator [Cellulomonas sp. S1-8]
MVTPAHDTGKEAVSPTTGAQPVLGGPGARRPTITDVAKAAGVSIAVVSYALNGRPGVSAATRERVLRVADEFGWRPSAAARSMRSGPRAVGLVVDRGLTGAVGYGAHVLEFVVALQDVLATRRLALVLQVVDDLAAAVTLYGEWWAERRFDVMVVTDVRTEDPRLDALRRLRIPAVVVGAGEVPGEVANVKVDDEGAAERVGRYLMELGHRHVGSVTGPASLHRTRTRVAGLERALDAGGATLAHEPTGGSPEEAAAACRRLLTGDRPPTAVVFDTDHMAVAALDVARRTGLAVPWDVSIVALSDSPLCRLATPSITSLPSVQLELGTAVGEAVLSVLDSQPTPLRHIEVGGLAVRGSTGPRSR